MKMLRFSKGDICGLKLVADGNEIYRCVIRIEEIGPLLSPGGTKVDYRAVDANGSYEDPSISTYWILDEEIQVLKVVEGTEDDGRPHVWLSDESNAYQA